MPKYSYLIEITWSELKSLRDDNKLIPGRQYRIVDYRCTTLQENTKSANHQFDIIVTADSSNVLNENARAIEHTGDTYFSKCNLSSWIIKYKLDNSYKFKWSDSEGTGVIYYMKDDKNNEFPYDFKNIMFKSFDTKLYYYTLSTITDDVYDCSVINDMCCNNNCGEYKTHGIYELPFNMFINSNDETAFNNHLGVDCYENLFYGNCYNNIFVSNCYNNILHNGCCNNTLNNNCYKNSLGNKCHSNIFNNNCYDNIIGNCCSNNTFGNNCYGNRFGHYCNMNTFGNNCYEINFGDNITIKSFYRYIIVESGNGCIGINCTETTSNNNYYQNVYISQGVNNSKEYWEISDSNVNQQFKTTIVPTSSITIKK